MIRSKQLRCKKLAFITGFLLVTSITGLAQDKDEVIRVETQLVEVPVAVTTPGGEPLRGLKQSNFIVYEDGKKQDITDFSAVAEPFEVALLLDTSGSTR